MKNKYVGDTNDYLKYSLLRRIQLARGSRPLFVAWMLIPGDSRPDGEKLGYFMDAEGNLLDLIAIKHEVEDELGFEVDVVADVGRSRRLKDQVLREAVPV